MLTITLFILTAALGFMMAYLYKHAYTTLQTLSPSPYFSFRIFIGLYTTGIVLLYGIGWYAANQLYNSRVPEEAKITFHTWYEVHTLLLPLIYLVLVLLSNAYSQSHKKLEWLPYLFSFLFFAVFHIRDHKSVLGYLVKWQQNLGMIQALPETFDFMFWLKLALCFITTAFNALIVWWGLKK